jgi:hypothetical protein
MFTKLITGARLATLPAIATTPLCALLLPIAASILLQHVANQLLDQD